MGPICRTKGLWDGVTNHIPVVGGVSIYAEAGLTREFFNDRTTREKKIFIFHKADPKWNTELLLLKQQLLLAPLPSLQVG